jgi:hypothetical protein
VELHSRSLLALLAATQNHRPRDDVGTVDVGVDDDRAASELGAHASRAERKAAPSSSVRSSMIICS